MSKIVIELPNVPVSGDLEFRLFSADPNTGIVDSSVTLRCRVVCVPGDVVSIEPYFSSCERSD